MLFNLTFTGVFLYLLFRLLISFWISPARTYTKLKRNGFGGPTPKFPLGNIEEMKKISASSVAKVSSGSLAVSNDIHSAVFPYFAQWQKSHGKVFVYWLGTEPFLYIAEPEFLRRMSKGVLGKSWGKPSVFKHDRKPMFGNGLLMLEGDDWIHHRRIITPAFSPANLQAMASSMVESTTKMLDKWTSLLNCGCLEIDVEREIILTAGEIIAKTSFGMDYANWRQVLEKLRALQITLFKTNRYVGVPFSTILFPRQTLEAKKLGKDIDYLLFSIIEDRRNSNAGYHQNNLLGLLLQENHEERRKTLTTRELVDECKTFFFGGHETSALALAWTMLVLAVHPEWQNQLREEITQVTGNKEIVFSRLAKLNKMGWVLNEVLRLYSPAPNAQRQTREDITVNNLTIPKGTNVWIDVVSMHHDPNLWGEDVNEFKPERFENDLYGGCKHKMGYLPFGFGGRMCIGRNLSMMEYKIVLSLMLTRFSFSLSPNYSHSPRIMLSLRPSLGIPLIVRPL
ncbi:cytokinin hydroxylase isoform X1 [Manihot esculenta]|uniref:Cytokinin hydroxylase n=2 Tax=Manihot esculenta TaxID=3983 RepID=A0A2C9UI48_MANES|nr:cytokinin hydroxylase isoform X1 [Manihot esculenta]OAY30366.1 hypothetical protein MANES_14G025100v8 [Manihot esculenta]